jgi:hypothetical protein
MNFGGRQTSEPKGAIDKLPHGADNSYFPFEFVSHPNSWEVCPIVDDNGTPKIGPVPTGEINEDGAPVTEMAPLYEWLPRLKKFFHMPGVNGVGTGKRGTNKPNLDRAILKLAKEGWTRIPWDAFPDGYIVEFDGARGTIYASVFMYPEVVGSGDRATLTWDWQHPKSIAAKKAITYNDFRRSLVVRGTVPPLTRRTRNAVTDVAKNRAKRWHKHAHVPAVAERIADNAARLKAARTLKAPQPR